MRFRSRVDVLFWGVLLASALPAGVVAASVGVGALPALVLCLGLPLWLLRSTYYDVGPDELLIRSGPFRWRIALREITSVQRSRSLISGPALSLRRLRVDYGRGRSVLISPADEAAFLRAIGR